MAEVFAAMVFGAALFAVLGVGGLTIMPALPRMAALLRTAGRADAVDLPGRAAERATLVRAGDVSSRPNRLISRPMFAKAFAT